jgi:hypothetical protein
MADLTVIIHGWSDVSDSFQGLKKRLVAEGVGTVKEILYADYESREDSITFNDVVSGLHDCFRAEGIIDEEGKALKKIDVIVHSTGGLVIRNWIYCYYYKDGDRIKDCPVEKIVMLAPANFGSPLAHRGKSFLGSLIKGRWKMGDFLEVGRQLLNGLELASPFQWRLAHQDLLSEKPYFNATQIQVTVLVGAKDYEGVRGWVNKPGTDGTVVIAGTSIDTVKVVLDFARPDDDGEDYVPFAWNETNAADDFAFGVLKELDHGSIVGESAEGGSEVSGHIVTALKASTAAEFRALQKSLEEVTKQTYAETAEDEDGNIVPAHQVYQQFVVHAMDQFGEEVRDFTLEFFVLAARKVTDAGVINDGRIAWKEEAYTQLMNDAMLREVHTHSIDSSFRRLLVDLEEVKAILTGAATELGEPVVLGMRVYVPDVDKGIKYDVDALQNIVIVDPRRGEGKGMKFFYPNTTTLVELRVRRKCELVKLSR